MTGRDEEPWLMDSDWLAERFEEHRAHLRAVAYRMLGSPTEADDAVQETWMRLSRSDSSAVQNLGGWLTTVVARVCLNMLSSRQSRREDPAGSELPEPAPGPAESADPEQQALLADAIGLALLVVLDTLAPAERLAFVLHDMFDVPFDEIAPIVDRSPAAARQLASRARRRVRAADGAAGADPGRQREVVTAFLAASRGGDFDALLALLDPDAVLRADATAVRLGAPEQARGAAGVASFMHRRAGGASPAIVSGAAGAAWMVGGRPRVVFSFTVARGRITAIDLIADPEPLRQLALVMLGPAPERGSTAR
jgi:RNA polymerase sigma factor (sigma-70 family)